MQMVGAFEFEGKQYVFGHYGQPKPNDVFINHNGLLVQFLTPASNITRLILKPLEIHHTFGGVVWREGDKRQLHDGEAGLNSAGKFLAFPGGSMSEYITLIPITLASPAQGR